MNTKVNNPDRSTPRIVSLLPGATEWVCELGLAEFLVGVSHECDFPESVRDLPKVTRSRIDVNAPSRDIDQAVRDHSESRTPLFDLDANQLQRLEPTLILTQTLCNVCAVSESDVRRSLHTLEGCQLVDLKATTLGEVIGDAKLIIEATQRQKVSDVALQRLEARIERVKSAPVLGKKPSVTLLEWADPLFCAGHWTPELIEWAGGVDPIGVAGEPSRQIDDGELVAADPDILLVACCGLDAARNQAEAESLARISGWRELTCVKNNAVHVFDGSAWFNRPGPRLVDALEAVHKILNR